jgi:hypothetical protein
MKPLRSSGSRPDRLLLDNVKEVSDDILVNAFGMLPDNEVFEITRSLSNTNLPMELGSVPFKGTLCIIREVNADVSPIPDGIEPENSLNDTSSDCNSGKSSNSKLGSLPLSEFPDRVK